MHRDELKGWLGGCRNGCFLLGLQKCSDIGNGSVIGDRGSGGGSCEWSPIK